MKRIVQPELLDRLPSTDPAATRSRRDLRRVNAWMHSHAIAAGTLKGILNGNAPGQILDLGAGDGDFLLQVGRKLAPSWPGVAVTLLDRQAVPKGSTLTAFAQLGWRTEVVVADAFEWAKSGAPVDVVMANLFLHHFEEAELVKLLEAIARRAKVFVAMEPLRGRRPLLGCKLLWAIGCNRVTRHDAAISVRAGFRDRELSALWPDKTGWQLEERSAGLFNHLFVARRKV